MRFAYQGLLDDLRVIAFSLKMHSCFSQIVTCFWGGNNLHNTTTTEKVSKAIPGRQCKGLSVVTHDLIPCPVEIVQSC